MGGKYFDYFTDLLRIHDKDSSAIENAYAFLLGRLETFAQYVDNEEYSIPRNEIASMLGFELTEKEKK